ncbi:MAG: CDP-alcohol phosphatidyltransferase family protein [Kofleriaceae bacterium]
MSRLTVIAPALVPLAGLVLSVAVYAARHAIGRPPVVEQIKSNELFGPRVSRWAYWTFRPFERALLTSGISPNAITTASLVACIGAGVALALGHLATGAWLYAAGGILDLLDGRVARALGRQSQAGALFDSVADRWAELAMFAGYAWWLRETPWLMAVLGCSAGSMMVSYTRARAEGLGIALRGGAMQRAERIVLVIAGTMAAAILGAEANTAAWAVPTAGGFLALCGVLSAATALRRWADAYRALGEPRRRDSAARTPSPSPIDAAPAPVPPDEQHPPPSSLPTSLA